MTARVRRRRILPALLVVATIAGCRHGGPGRPPAGLDALRPEALGNLAYRGVESGTVQLVEGRWEGEPPEPGAASIPRVDLAPMTPAVGDLDDDGTADAAVLLTENFGGSGVFYYLAIVSSRDGRLANVATTALGDRPQVRALAIDGGVVSADLVVAGPDDGACCPTTKVRRAFRLTGATLAALPEVAGGVLGVADLEGTEWRLDKLDWDTPVAAGVTVTVRFAERGVSGSGGCNRYRATVTGGDAAALTIGPVAATRMACPAPAADVEAAFVERLAGVKRFGWLFGKLRLDYERDDRWGMLVFVPGSTPPVPPR